MNIARREVRIPVEKVLLTGDLQVPEESDGLVLFVHGSGSSRLSHRNRHVADIINQRGLSTLLFDLLSPEEEEIDMVTRELRFDIGLLADRVDAVTNWLGSEDDLDAYPLGYFGASTGAAAALVASLRHPNAVKAIVSRGGRPDLAAAALPDVVAPTLLIVGSLDEAVIEMNRKAMSRMRCEVDLQIIPGASHLFPEPGKLDEVATLASTWFARHLAVVV
ncbi:MAG TPA: dienelactone hydrolase family protein [Fimbriimonadaceae bacterium]|nr:dienelactone hydrolase family protein [Fimbriimonadaceae bacterium]